MSHALPTGRTTAATPFQFHRFGIDGDDDDDDDDDEWGGPRKWARTPRRALVT